MPAITKTAERFTEAEVDDEIVIMTVDNGEFFSLSGSGAAIWRLIDGTRDRQAVLAALEASFDADRERLEADLDEFLEELSERRLIG
jgi:hypothetical protein